MRWGYPPPPYPGMYVSAHLGVCLLGAKYVNDTAEKNPPLKISEIRTYILIWKAARGQTFIRSRVEITGAHCAIQRFIGHVMVNPGMLIAVSQLMRLAHLREVNFTNYSFVNGRAMQNADQMGKSKFIIIHS